jgi:hypothetical protein
MTGAGQAGVVPTLSDARASGHSPLPSAKLQLLVVDVQQTDAAFQANANGGPLKHYSSLVLWNATHEEVCVQVEAISATWALTHNRGLTIHGECALTPMP